MGFWGLLYLFLQELLLQHLYIYREYASSGGGGTHSRIRVLYFFLPVCALCDTALNCTSMCWGWNSSLLSGSTGSAPSDHVQIPRLLWRLTAAVQAGTANSLSLPEDSTASSTVVLGALFFLCPSPHPLSSPVKPEQPEEITPV